LATPDPGPPSSSRRIAVIYGSVVTLVVVVVAAVLVLFHSKGSPGPSATTPGPSSGPVVGNFAFTVKRVRAVPTGATAGTTAAATAAAKRIERTMDSLYFTGYLDESAWRSGSYDAAWKLFSRDAQARARRDEGRLTLGSGAGSRYTSVTAGPNAAYVRVLMDRSGHPATAVVTVRFTAKAQGTGGTSSIIRSTGAYFLLPGHRGWSIAGYEVKRVTS
jgi:hypothetical protein